MKPLGERSTGEIMVLTITFTVCFGVVASGFLVAVITIINPDKDVTVWISRITGILNTMLGLLAGFLAGRTDANVIKQQQQPSEE